MTNSFEKTLQKIVESLCRYFDWDYDSEQAGEISRALHQVRNETIDECIRSIDRRRTSDFYIDIIRHLKSKSEWNGSLGYWDNSFARTGLLWLTELIKNCMMETVS